MRGARTRHWLRPALLLFLLTLVVFARAAFSTEAFSARDVQRSYYPLKMYWAERVSHLELPQWFPYDGMGQPYISALVSAALHPLNLLYLVLPLESALKWGLLLSYFAAALGVFGLARRLGLMQAGAFTAASLYAFSGYLISLSNNPHYVHAAAALPFVFWATHAYLFDGRAAALLGAAVSLAWVALAGDPQNFFVAQALVAAMCFIAPPPQRGATLVRAGVLLASGAALAAAQIVPALAVREHIAAQNYSLDTALSWSAHPLRVVEFFTGPLWLDASAQRMLPGIATAFDAAHEAAWVDSQHLTPLALILALTAMSVASFRARTGGWLAGWLFLFVLWLGRFTPIAGLFHALPLWGSFRYPEKLTPWLLLGLSLAAGAGLHHLALEAHARRRALQWSVLVTASLLFGALLETALHWPSTALAQWASLGSLASEQLHANIVQHLGTSAAVSGLLAALLYLARTRPQALSGIAALVAVHLVAQGAGLYWLTGLETLETKPELLSHLTAPPKVHPRVLSRVGTAAVPDALGAVSLPTFMAYTTAESLRPLTPTRWGVESMSSYLPAAHRALDKSEEALQAFAPLWGTEYVLTREGQTVDSAQVVARSAELKLSLWKFEHARPRAYLSLAAALRPPLSAASAQALMLGSPPLSQIDAAPAPANTDITAPVSLGTVVFEQYAPEHVVLWVEAAVDSYLVLNDAAHPGWEATVDNQKAPLLLANEVARAVAVPAGKHRVAMHYATPGLQFGALVSLVTLLALVAFAVWNRTA
ncbi:MAG: YfhO family protein [Myxococcaceae bacterium]|nr:YfhO family protein [Myxococcaceae bacterium]